MMVEGFTLCYYEKIMDEYLKADDPDYLREELLRVGFALEKRGIAFTPLSPDDYIGQVNPLLLCSCGGGPGFHNKGCAE